MHIASTIVNFLKSIEDIDMNSTNLFRQKALDQLSSPEQLDLLVKQVPLRGWIFLIAFGIIIVSTILWGLFGSISTKVNGSGIIMESSGITREYVAASGSINKIYVKNYDNVKKGDLIASILQPEERQKISIKEKELDRLKEKNSEIQVLKKVELQASLQVLQDSTNVANHRIRILKEKIKRLEKDLDAQKQLYKQGLITKYKLEQAQDSIDNELTAIKNLRNRVLDNDEKIIESRDRLVEVIRGHEEQVIKASEELELLNYELSLTTEIRSSEDGKVFQILVVVGDTVRAGSSIIAIERAGSNSNMNAIFFVSAMEGKLIDQGFSANVSPSSVKKEEFGFIKAKIDTVDTFPASRKEVMNILNNDELTSLFLKNGPTIVVYASLEKDSTFSGLKWSSSKGPDVHISSGTMCNVQVTVKKQPPISLVIPFFKQSLGL